MSSTNPAYLRSIRRSSGQSRDDEWRGGRLGGAARRLNGNRDCGGIALDRAGMNINGSRIGFTLECSGRNRLAARGYNPQLENFIRFEPRKIRRNKDDAPAGATRTRPLDGLP